MFVENLVSEFYNVISKQKVLIFVNYDIDAICAAKILQSVFRHDTVAYTLIPITTTSELKDAYREHINDVKYVILINCGGTIDLVETLEPEQHVEFFVADSHRPTDLYNIYVNNQVKLLCKADSEENIPDYFDVFREDDEEEDDDINDIDNLTDNEDEGGEESRATKRARLDERVLEKRRERRLWEENCQRIMFEYVQFSYYGRSCAITIFELSWQLHRDNIDLLWWGIVGVVEQFILNKVEILHYLNEVERISAHIGRLCQNPADVLQSQNSLTGSTQAPVTASTFRIECEKDLQLALYRHWTIEASLKYTMFTAVALKLWAIKGESRLQKILAEMGLPLSQSKQQYNTMDLTLRKEFHGMMEKMSDSRNLAHITYPSFTLVYGYRTKYQAADYVYSILALLSNTMRGRTARDNFFDALDSLTRTNKELINDGIEKSKKFLVCMFRQVQNALEMRQVISAGPFFYYVIQDDSVNSRYYSKPDCLWLLATFTLRAYVAASRRSRAARLPLLASAPLDDGFCLVVGVPPVSESVPRSFFGQAFEQVAEKTGCTIHTDYFDSTVVKISVADRPKIFDALAMLLS